METAAGPGARSLMQPTAKVNVTWVAFSLPLLSFTMDEFA